MTSALDYFSDFRILAEFINITYYPYDTVARLCAQLNDVTASVVYEMKEGA